MENTLVKKLL